jgi:hypothetical protein
MGKTDREEKSDRLRINWRNNNRRRRRRNREDI